MKKSAFSMITAIIFIIIISVAGVNVLKTSQNTVSFATRAYIKEQAELVAEAGKQIAVLRWLESDPNDKTNAISNATAKEYYYFPNKFSPQYRLTISFIPPESRDKLTKFDKATTLAKIIVESDWKAENELEKKNFIKPLLGDVAQIRLIRYFIIGN